MSRVPARGTGLLTLALWLSLLPGCASGPRVARDEERRSFTVRRIPKVEGQYQLLDAHTVRVYPFSTYRLERQDERALYVRVYEPVLVVPSVPARALDTLVSAAPVSHRFALRRLESGLPSAGQWREGFDLADLDGDGHLDLAHGPPRMGGTAPRLFLGDGHGRFLAWEAARFPPLRYDYGDAAVADFDGDGHLDLALAVHFGGLVVLLGDGRGAFREGGHGLPFRGSSKERVFSSRAVEVADWNGDGRPDLLALADRPQEGRDGFRVFLNRPEGFEELAPEATASPVFGDSLVAIDGGRAAVVSSRVLGATTLLRRASAAGIESRPLDGLRGASYVWAVAAGRLDGDDTDDLVIGSNAVDVHYRRKEGSLSRTLWVGDPGRDVTALAVGDVDGDGARDVVALLSDGSIVLLPGDGRGSFTRDAEVPAPAGRRGCGGTHVRLADLDGDGRDEIVASFSGERNPLAPERSCDSGGALEIWSVVPCEPATRADGGKR